MTRPADKKSLREQYDSLFVPLYAPAPPLFVSAKGARITADDGREFIDLSGGIAVVSLGHCAPPIADALADQSRKLWHTSNLYASEAPLRLAESLVAHTFAERVFLCNSGAEANEAALKLARKFGVSQDANKYAVLAFDGGFHGRIGLALAASGQEKLKQGLGPLAPGFRHSEFNNLSAAEKAMDKNICAIIVESVQGEAGIKIADNSFLRGLKHLCEKYNALLIFDEVQTGVGRCGALYDYMNCDVIPDILTTAKGLGGGFPVAAMLSSAKAAAVFSIGDHGTTFGGNALAARVANEIINIVADSQFINGIRQRGEIMMSRLGEINSRRKCFSDIRGKGMLVGCDLHDGIKIADVRAAALDKNVLVLSAGKNTLRLAPPLNIALEDLAEGLARLDSALGQFAD